VQIVVEIVPVLERQPRADHRLGQAGAAAHANQTAVEEGAVTTGGREQAPAGGVEDHADDDGVVDSQGDRHAVIRDAVQEVRRPCERIDEPGAARRTAARPDSSALNPWPVKRVDSVSMITRSAPLSISLTKSLTVLRSMLRLVRLRAPS